MVEFMRLQHRDILSYLSKKDPIRNVFASYIARKTPDGRSFCMKDGNHVTGCAISGAPFGLYEVFCYWVVCDTNSNTLRFYDFLSNTISNMEFYFTLEHLEFVQQIFPNSKISKDIYYCLFDDHLFTPIDDDHTIIRLEREKLEKINIPYELKDKIGSFEYFVKGIPCFGLTVGNTLVAMAEASVSNSVCQTIQQVYTVKEFRNRTFAKQVTSRLVKDIISNNRVPTYLVEENNLNSIRIPLSLDFTHDFTFGRIDTKKAGKE